MILEGCAARLEAAPFQGVGSSKQSNQVDQRQSHMNYLKLEATRLLKAQATDPPKPARQDYLKPLTAAASSSFTSKTV
jgi:hypothetical protein